MNTQATQRVREEKLFQRVQFVIWTAGDSRACQIWYSWMYVYKIKISKPFQQQRKRSQFCGDCQNTVLIQWSAIHPKRDLIKELVSDMRITAKERWGKNKIDYTTENGGEISILKVETSIQSLLSLAFNTVHSVMLKKPWKSSWQKQSKGGFSLLFIDILAYLWNQYDDLFKKNNSKIIFNEDVWFRWNSVQNLCSFLPHAS